jgi:ribokinase
MGERWITVMGSFIADLAFRTPRLPAWGETVMGSDFKIGPGGKGSNQAVAAARLGGRVTFICMLGRDTFGDLARATYRQEGIDTEFCFETSGHPTGAASVIVHEGKGENAIVVVPGSGFHLTTADVDRAAARIKASAVFVTGLEVPIPVVEHALKLAHAAGVPTILNPAPAAPLPDRIYPLCDYLTPNETEAAGLLAMKAAGGSGVEKAAEAFLKLGVQNAIITLGKQGALVRNAKLTRHVPAIDAGPVVETTGAGDAFTGGLAMGLAEGLDVVAATRLGCATAGISVTRYGTAPAMPRRDEVNVLLAREP